MIALAFTPAAGRSSKRVTTGPGCTATTSASMPKSLSFTSTRRDSASSASEEYAGSRGGGSSSRLSGGSSPAFTGLDEQRNLPLFLDALALLDHRLGRLDARRRAVADFFCSAFTTSERALLAFAPFCDFPLGGELVAHEADGRPELGADPVNDGEPRNPERERHARHPHGQKQQRGAEEVQPVREVRAPRGCPRHRRRSGASRPGAQCSVVSPQLAISTIAKPAALTALLARVERSSFLRL